MASKNARYPKGFRASLFILVTPLLGLRAAAVLSNIAPQTKNAALADQLTHASFASKQCHHSFRQLLSTDQRQSGILVNVHSASSFEGIAQHNQLLRFRSNGLLPREQPPEISHLGSESYG